MRTQLLLELRRQLVPQRFLLLHLEAQGLCRLLCSLQPTATGWGGVGWGERSAPQVYYFASFLSGAPQSPRCRTLIAAFPPRSDGCGEDLQFRFADGILPEGRGVRFRRPRRNLCSQVQLIRLPPPPPLNSADLFVAGIDIVELGTLTLCGVLDLLAVRLSQAGLCLACTLLLLR